MQPEDPRLNPALLPDGTRPFVVAEHQSEYVQLPSVVTPSGVVITRWSLSEQERQAIIDGDDVFIGICTFGQPLQPLRCVVGPVDWSDV